MAALSAALQSVSNEGRPTASSKGPDFRGVALHTAIGIDRVGAGGFSLPLMGPGLNPRKVLIIMPNAAFLFTNRPQTAAKTAINVSSKQAVDATFEALLVATMITLFIASIN